MKYLVRIANTLLILLLVASMFAHAVAEEPLWFGPDVVTEIPALDSMPSFSEETENNQDNFLIFQEGFYEDAPLTIEEQQFIPESVPTPVYRATFYDPYGNVYAWADVSSGDFLIEPARPQIPGYVFQYWYDEAYEFYAPYRFGEPVTRDINLWPLLTQIEEEPSENHEDSMVDEHTDPQLYPENIQEHELFQSIQSILMTPEPIHENADEALDSQTDDIEESGTVPQCTEDPAAISEDMDQPFDARTLVAEIVEGIIGSQDPAGSDQAADTAMETTQPESASESETNIHDITVSLIEAILQTPYAETTETEPPLSEDGVDTGIKEDETSEPSSTADDLSEDEGIETQEPGDMMAEEGATATPQPAMNMENTDEEEAQEESLFAGSDAIDSETTLSDYSPVVSITSYSPHRIIGVTSPVTLTAEVHGVPEGALLVYQWQNDAGGHFEDIPGATSSAYSYTVDAENIDCNWRLEVQVITK